MAHNQIYVFNHILITLLMRVELSLQLIQYWPVTSKVLERVLNFIALNHGRISSLKSEKKSIKSIKVIF